MVVSSSVTVLYFDRLAQSEVATDGAQRDRAEEREKPRAISGSLREAGSAHVLDSRHEQAGEMLVTARGTWSESAAMALPGTECAVHAQCEDAPDEERAEM